MTNFGGKKIQIIRRPASSAAKHSISMTQENNPENKRVINVKQLKLKNIQKLSIENQSANQSVIVQHKEQDTANSQPRKVIKSGSGVL